jgi:hypothetical protein
VKPNRWILFGAPALIAGLMLVGASFAAGGANDALAGTQTFQCDATATPTVVLSQREGAGNTLSMFQAAPTDTPTNTPTNTSTPTCTPTSRPKTYTPSPSPTAEDTVTPAPSNTPPPPPTATNTPAGGGAGVITPPDTGTGDGASGTSNALIWLVSGIALAVVGSGALVVGLRRRS